MICLRSDSDKKKTKKKTVTGFIFALHIFIIFEILLFSFFWYHNGMLCCGHHYYSMYGESDIDNITLLKNYRHSYFCSCWFYFSHVVCCQFGLFFFFFFFSYYSSRFVFNCTLYYKRSEPRVITQCSSAFELGLLVQGRQLPVYYALNT